MLLRCGHHFHRSCLDVWWQRSQSRICPICRQTDADATQDLAEASASIPAWEPAAHSQLYARGGSTCQNAVTQYLLYGGIRRQSNWARQAHRVLFAYGHYTPESGPDTARRRRTGQAPEWCFFLRLEPNRAGSGPPAGHICDYVEKMCFRVHEGLRTQIFTVVPQDVGRCIELKHRPPLMKPTMAASNSPMSLSRHVMRSRRSCASGEPGSTMVEMHVVWHSRLRQQPLKLHHAVVPGAVQAESRMAQEFESAPVPMRAGTPRSQRRQLQRAQLQQEQAQRKKRQQQLLQRDTHRLQINSDVIDSSRRCCTPVANVDESVNVDLNLIKDSSGPATGTSTSDTGSSALVAVHEKMRQPRNTRCGHSCKTRSLPTDLWRVAGSPTGNSAAVVAVPRPTKTSRYRQDMGTQLRRESTETAKPRRRSRSSRSKTTTTTTTTSTATGQTLHPERSSSDAKVNFKGRPRRRHRQPRSHALQSAIADIESAGGAPVGFRAQRYMQYALTDSRK